MRKPLICISTEVMNRHSADKTHYVAVTAAYPEAVAASGGIPFPAPECYPDEIAQLCDGLVLTGGADVDPSLYGEALLNNSVFYDRDRDNYEMSLCRAFLKYGKPIFTICRGFQLLNVVLGGTLYQDLVEQKSAVHMDPKLRHYVTTDENSVLHNLFGERFKVNSTHHQAVKTLAEGLHITAVSDEGIVEAYEHDTLPILGTQFHPERLTGRLYDGQTPDMKPLWDHFISLCKA